MAIYGGTCETFKVIGKTETHILSSFPEIDVPRYGNKAKIIDVGKSLHFPNQINSTILRMLISMWGFIQHLFFFVLYKTIGLKAVKIMKSEIWKTYATSDAIIVGHNGAFGVIGGGLAVPLFFMHFYVPLLLKVLGKSVIVYGGSIGLSKNFLIKALVRYVLNRMDLITLREGITYEYLKKMGVKNRNMFVLPDPALLLPPASYERANEILLAEGISNDSRPLIGLTVTHRIASNSSPNLGDAQKQYQRHVKLMAEVIDNLIEQTNAKIIFLPHCIEFYHNRDDRLVSKDIYKLCKNKTEVKVITNEYTAEELKAIMAKCDMFIGERIHSVIGAMSMGVPTLALGLSNDQRLTGIIEGVFKEETLTGKLETLDADLLFEKIMKVWQKREEIGERLKLKMETLKREAMTNGELLKKVIESKRNKL